MAAIPEILQLLRENRFERAIPVATEALRQAAGESPQRLTAVARDLVRFQGFFGNIAEARTSEAYFRTVHKLLAELAGPESPDTMAAAENLAGLLGSIDKVDEAIGLREKVLEYLSSRFPNEDTRVMRVRDGLSVLYQRAGREDKLAELYKETGLCEHLQPAENYIREKGGRILSSGRPWSANCHIWIYFDVLLDCDRLIHGLGLAPCVVVHDHRGTHDGSERGILCSIHRDGIMGPHPADAPPSTRTVTVP